MGEPAGGESTRAWTHIGFERPGRTGDPRAWSSAFAPDIVVHSPVIQAPFEGIEAATELWGVLFATLRDVEITDESSDGDSHAFFWRPAAGRRTIEGAALVELDGRGRIREISVLIRPLANLATFAEVVGPALAAQRGRGRHWCFAC